MSNLINIKLYSLALDLPVPWVVCCSPNAQHWVCFAPSCWETEVALGWPLDKYCDLFVFLTFIEFLFLSDWRCLRSFVCNMDSFQWWGLNPQGLRCALWDAGPLLPSQSSVEDSSRFIRHFWKSFPSPFFFPKIHFEVSTQSLVGHWGSFFSMPGCH